MALHVTGELGSIKRSRLLLIRSSAPPGGGTPRPCLATPGGGLLLDATPCSLPSPAPNKTTFTPAGGTSRGPSLCLPLNIVPTQTLFRAPHLKQAPRCEPCRTPGAKSCRRSQEEPGGEERRGEELQPPLSFLRARALPWPGRMCRGQKARVGLPRNRRCDS